ncbi:MAG: formylglycine-generating enzyme family protein, partial [Pseudomonadota bacterium]
RAAMQSPPIFLDPPRRRGLSFGRRFSAREVAIGATGGLVLMTAATALLAPIVLPAAFDSRLTQPPPAAATEETATPEPSSATPVTLATLSASAAANNPTTELINPSVSAQEPLGVNSADVDDQLFPAIDGPASPLEADNSDAAAPAGDVRGADSDAMENLIAAVSADALDEAASISEIEPLPAAVAENTYLGNYFKECVECPDMAALPAGSFEMGARAGETTRGQAERPAFTVSISKRFAIGTREVTYAQWDACVADGGCAHAPSDHGWGRGKQPVVSVSYADALAYTAWLSEKTGQPYRLPTEAEWEYAARAGGGGAFAFGDDVTTRQANFNGEFPYRGAPQAFRKRTTPAASFPPNAFGLFDMHGNAWEWTADCWNASHAGAPVDGSARTGGDCSRRVLKGGAWNTGAWRLRAAHRIAKPQTAREFDNGFRVARDLD